MEYRIRKPIKWFSCFMSLMLFQTPVMGLGSKFAILTLLMTIFVSFYSRNTSLIKFKMQLPSVLLVCFMAVFLLSGLINGGMPRSFYILTAHVVLCIVLLSLTALNPGEDLFLRKIFISAAVFYAALAVYSCYSQGAGRYYHGRILIFKAAIDPNFIGIPFVAGATLLMDDILKGKNRVWSIPEYAIILCAIVYTGSRANMLCLILSQFVIISAFVFNHEIRFSVKMIWMIFMLGMLGFGIRYFSVNFPQQWERMNGLTREAGRGLDNGRFLLWKRALQAWIKSPVLGVGIGGMYRDFGKASHNTYLQILSETGIAGFFCMIAFFCTILRKSFKNSISMFTLNLVMLLQIGLLDALADRSVWIILIWCSMLPQENIPKENACTT